jgi:hypothetical protein
MTRPIKALDVSFSPISPGWAAARKAEGWEVFIQCVWTGGYANNAHVSRVAARNLKVAREAGMITAGYLNTNPWFPAETSLREARTNAGAEWSHLEVVFNDVEIAGVTEQQIKDHCLAIEGAGKRTAIYSARWFWSSIGDPKWPWLRAYDIWAADYDGDPFLGTTALFGPWSVTDVIGKQYRGSTDIGGVQVDLNVFAEGFFKEGDEMCQILTEPWVDSRGRRTTRLDYLLLIASVLDDGKMGKLYGGDGHEADGERTLPELIRAIVREELAAKTDGAHRHG